VEHFDAQALSGTIGGRLTVGMMEVPTESLDVAALMANHGAVALGRSMDEALTCARIVEKGCRAFVEAEFLGGAKAISVVTDNKFFGGKLGLIDEIKKMTALPILRKDFIIDPYQVYESRAAKADALLLIAAIIPEKLLPRLVSLTGSLGMVPVVEGHTQPELKRATKAGADVILINNRDLATMKVNTQTVSRLIKLVPKDIAVIAASGYETPDDLTQITSDRLRAFLLGRVLLESKTPDRLLHEMSERLLKS